MEQRKTLFHKIHYLMTNNSYLQVEYESEGIEWRSVKFEDNSECIDLIAKKPTGLLPLLDEECR